MAPIVSISKVCKTYEDGGEALKNVSLDIQEGEIIALLGPNGAGKTTLISAICGLTSLTSGSISVAGFDITKDYRKTRSLIGLVPQEISIEPFQTVTHALNYSRGLFGRPRDARYIESLLKKLSLWDKADSKVMQLSGGMKRRVLIGKALSHEPRVLFLDEPTAGVDVELRKDMWDVIAELKADGVTIILTTHYIEEAEAIADRIGVIANGEILLVEGKSELIQRMGAKTMHVELQSPIKKIPAALKKYKLSLSEDGAALQYVYDTRAERTGITALLTDINAAGLTLKDVQTSQSSLEDIFVDLVKE